MPLFRLTDQEKIDLFWSQVAIGAPDECWEWQGRRSVRGDGVYTFKGHTSAYRVAYYLANGDIAPGLCVMHACDNRACCNPAHLSLGTHADNMRDKVEKGRQWRGGAKRRKDGKGWILR